MTRENPYYDDSHIFKRWSMLLDTFEKFKVVYEKHPAVKNPIAIDARLLLQAVISYYHDVARFKWWHFKWWNKENQKRQKIDENKMFAFTLFWLMKTRPIYIPSDLDDTLRAYSSDKSSFDSDPTLLANAHFALIASFNFLPFSLRGKALQELLYHVTYRSPNPYDLIVYADVLSSMISDKDGRASAVRRVRSDATTDVRSGGD